MEAPQDAPRSAGWVWAERLLYGGMLFLAVLALVAVMLYRFGTPMSATSEQRRQYAALAAAGEVPHAAARKAGLRIPIPGCTCHSDDPVKAVQHENIPLSQCKSCHGG